MKISKRSVNKTINLIDRHFTYDRREISDGSFSAMDYEAKKYVSFHPYAMGGYWFFYSNNTHQIYRVIRTYKDLNELKKLIKVLF